MTTAKTKRRATRRTKCQPIYLAILTGGGEPAECTYAHTERKRAEHYCKGFNDLDAGCRAVVRVVRYRLPAVKGGAR